MKKLGTPITLPVNTYEAIFLNRLRNSSWENIFKEHQVIADNLLLNLDKDWGIFKPRERWNVNLFPVVQDSVIADSLLDLEAAGYVLAGAPGLAICAYVYSHNHNMNYLPFGDLHFCRILWPGETNLSLGYQFSYEHKDIISIENINRKIAVIATAYPSFHPWWIAAYSRG
jgi:hypothetical protein